MMFIEFFVWGAWCVTLGTYLGDQGLKFSGKDIGLAYSSTAIAAIVSPFFVGMVADRFLPAQITMGVLHLCGGAIMYYASTLTTAGQFIPVLILYALFYMPSLALVNAISFHQMKDPGKQFPGIRVLGTIGWIVAGNVVSWLKWEDKNFAMQLAAAASVVLGVYSFFLPNTPPKAKGQKVTVSHVLGLDSLKLFKDKSFFVFAVCSLLICIPLAFYYNFTNMYLNELKMANAASKMSLGQVSEVFFMLVMPFFFARLGVKWMLAVGMLAWAVRYFFFAFGDTGALVTLLYLGILLHGVCYDFFFVTGFIYTDKKAPEEIRASAQGLLALLTYGVGMFIGSLISGYVVDMFKQGEALHNWKATWLVPGGMALLIMILFLVTFKDHSADAKS